MPLMKTCDYCHTNEAEVKCSKHGTRICGDLSCVRLHRWPGGNCNFVDPSRFDPMDWLLIFGIAVVVTAGVVISVAHF